MEESLPSARTVLDKLKSEGTFDKFRKTCLAAIEEEPSFRAQKEHVEVLSRRFLQNFYIKEGKTKNEVRMKLKSFVTDEIKKPGVQVGQPIEKLIDKTLEGRGPELFQKILEIIDKMQRPSPPPLPPDNPSIKEEQNKPPPPEPMDENGGRVPLPEESNQSYTTSSLEMPIDLLELSTFTNPLKREIKKGPKRSKPDTSTKETHRYRIPTIKQQDPSSERRSSLKAKDKDEEVSKTSSDKLSDKEPLVGVCNEKHNTTGVKSKTATNDEGDVSCDPVDTSSFTTSIEEKDEKTRSSERERKSTGNEVTTTRRSSRSLPASSDVDSNHSSDILSPSGGGNDSSKPTVVRRSARLASIEEERALGGTTAEKNNRRLSMDVELISDDEMEIDGLSVTERKMKKEDEEFTIPLTSSRNEKPCRSRKRPVTISSSDSEEEERTAEEETKGRKRSRTHPHNRKRVASPKPQETSSSHEHGDDVTSREKNSKKDRKKRKQ